MAVSLKDVAAVAGVSVTTASYVLNNKGAISEQTRLRVREAVRRTGYVRRAQSGGNLALINSPVGTMTSCLFQAAAEYGFALHTAYWDDTLDTPPEFHARKQISGVIVYGGMWKRSFLQRLASEYATVFLGSYLPTVRSDAVWADSAGAIYQAVDHLALHGHRSIGLINGPPHSATSAEKLAGFTRALRQVGEGVTGTAIAAEGFKVPAGRAAVEQLLDTQPGVSGIIAGEAHFGTAVREVCRARRLRIPEEISVVALRDISEFAAIPPALTAMPLPEMNIARAAVARLLHRIHEPGSPGQRVLIQPEIVQRESVAVIDNASDDTA